MNLEVFLLAVAFDLFLGEPPAKIHPVVWIGRLISFLQSHVQPARLQGLILALLIVFCTASVGLLLVQVASRLPLLGAIVAAYLLKSTFAIRCLLQTSSDIGKMIDNDIFEAKRMLPALVGRDNKDLSKTQATSAVIESLSENYVDTILSPIFYFLLFAPFGLGLEAALSFKAISTMDSMLGYKTKVLRELGYVPAKMDDLANYIPARLSIFIMSLAWPLRASEIIGTSLRYHRSTPSPNSGWPMSAAAGALGIRLEKPGFYVIFEDGREPVTSDIPRAIRLVGLTSALTLAASVMILILQAA